jgi:hypothetical protein
MGFLSLQHEKQKLQEEVIETLKSVAVLMPVYLEI